MSKEEEIRNRYGIRTGEISANSSCGSSARCLRCRRFVINSELEQGRYQTCNYRRRKRRRRRRRRRRRKERRGNVKE
jgi:ferredoxin